MNNRKLVSINGYGSWGMEKWKSGDEYATLFKELVNDETKNLMNILDCLSINLMFFHIK
jgi:hypothetical protein